MALTFPKHYTSWNEGVRYLHPTNPTVPFRAVFFCAYNSGMKSRESTPLLPSPEVSREDIIKHIESNTVDAKEGRKCVDDRYPNDTEDKGRLARPGGDFGYVMALLKVNKAEKLGLTAEQCVEAVHKAITQDGRKFFMHTDDEEGHTHTIGCGHITAALADKDIAEALAYVLQRKDSLYMARLKGKHPKRAVLKILGIRKTVNNRGMFVYEVERDKEFVRKLVEKMNINGLTAKNMQKAADEQTQETLEHLALGKPIYEINVDNEAEPIVKHAGHVTAEPLNKAA